LGNNFSTAVFTSEMGAQVNSAAEAVVRCVAEIIRIGDLELDQNLDFERRAWVWQRAAWVMMGAVLFAGLLGAFGGPGPLAKATVGSRDGLFIHYNHIARLGGTPDLAVSVAPDLVQGDKVVLAFDSELQDTFMFEQIDPQPASVASSGARMLYEFKADQPTQPIRINFHARAGKPGLARGMLGVEGGPQHELSIYVLP
jgi:hypothetical protein